MLSGSIDAEVDQKATRGQFANDQDRIVEDGLNELAGGLKTVAKTTKTTTMPKMLPARTGCRREVAEVGKRM